MSAVLTSRRRLLQLLGGAPLLPLSGSLSAAGLLTACGGGGDDDTPSAPFKSVSFVSMAAPTLAVPAAMATTTTNAAMSILYADNSTREGRAKNRRVEVEVVGTRASK